MFRSNTKNHAFDRMGKRFSPVVDEHFLGRRAFDIPWTSPRPKANLAQKENHLFKLQLAVHGFARAEIGIEVRDDQLIIKGEKQKDLPGAAMEFNLSDFDTDQFERPFRLAPGVRHEQITARYENGILTLEITHIPREERLQKAIEIG